MDDLAGRRGWSARAAMLAVAAATLSACAGGPRPELGGGRYAGSGTDRPYQVNGVWYYPKAQPNYDEIGLASWYGEPFQNRRTADGEVFDMNLPSAAHKTLPLPCLVEVTNLANGRRVVVRVNDRGPFVGGRVIDLSRAAANQLGFLATGVTKVRVRYVGQPDGPPARSPPLARQYQVAAPRPAAPAPLAAPMTVAAASPALQPPPVILEPNPPEADPGDPYPAGAVPPPPAPIVLASNPPEAAAQGSQIPDPATPVGAAYVASFAPVSTATLAPVAAPPPPVAAPVPTVQPTAPPPMVVAAAPVAAPSIAAPTPAVAQAPSGRYEVQAGAFASAATAQRIATALAGVGVAQVQPFEHSGRTLYRVVVRGLANPAAAETARSRAATLGMADARVTVGGV